MRGSQPTGTAGISQPLRTPCETTPLEDPIMNAKLLFLSAALVATGAMADRGGGNHGGNNGGNTPPACASCENSAVYIGAPSIQITAMSHSALKNSADDYATAVQNVSSNTAGVKIMAPSVQITALKGTMVSNYATDYATARQNLASNVGSVAVRADQLQVVAAKNSFIGNKATDYSRAVSTNNGCETCQ